MKKHLYFVTEGRFVRNKVGVFTVGGFTYKLWERYLTVFDKITIVARVKQDEILMDESFRSDGLYVDFFDLPYYVGPKDYLRVRSRFKQSIIKVADLIEKEEASIICRLPGLIGGKLAGLLYKKEINYACEVVGDPWDVYAPGTMTNPLRPFLRTYFTLQLKQQVSRAKQVLYVTESYLQHRYPAKSAIFTTNASNVQIKESDIHKRGDYNGILSAVRLLSIGSLDQMYKAPDIVLKAVCELSKKKINCNLIWIGGGRYLPSMVQLADYLKISHLVKFVGNISHDRINSFINEADIYLQVSRTEGLPRALIEAMSKGVVCIGTTVGGIPELLSEDALISKDSVQELVDCITKMINHPDLCNRLSQSNLSQSYKYSENVLQSKRREFYCNIIKE